MLKKILFLNLIILVLITGCAEKDKWVGEPVTGKRWKIDVLKYINNSYTQVFETMLREALNKNGLQENRDYKIRIRSAQGDMTNLSMIIDAAVNENSDLLVLFQSPTLYVALNKVPNMPKLFTLLQNPFILGAGGSDTDHLPNITGMYVVSPINELLEKIMECSPKIKTIGTIFMIGNDDSISKKDELIQSAKAKGIEIFAEGYTSQNDIIDAAAALFNKNPNAVIHLFDPAQDITFPALYKHARENRKPLFSVVYNMEKIGASIVCSTDREEIGAKFGEMVSRVLKGENISTMPFENDIALTKNFAINKFAASDARLTLPASLVDNKKAE